MIPEKFMDVLKNEGVVAIVTEGAERAHIVNTWNSYIRLTHDESLLAPVGGMNKTEANLKINNKVLVTMGSREVQGFHSKGTGFFIKGTAVILNQGMELDKIKQSFPWARAVLIIKPESITQTL